MKISVRRIKLNKRVKQHELENKICLHFDQNISQRYLKTECLEKYLDMREASEVKLISENYKI